MTLIAAFVHWLKSLFELEPVPAAAAAPADPAAPVVIGLDEVFKAIDRGIRVPMGLPPSSTNILVAQSALETGNWTAWYFQGPQSDGAPPTYNLFNRHEGSGKGEWTGATKYVSTADETIRIFKDIDQSARDFTELLRDPRYKWALIAIKNADAPGYAQAMQDAGFAAESGYAQAILSKYSRLVA